MLGMTRRCMCTYGTEHKELQCRVGTLQGLRARRWQHITEKKSTEIVHFPPS